MCHSLQPLPAIVNRSLNKQQGSMLVIALFIIIVLSVLVVSMSSVVRGSADTVIYEVYGLRAKQAAQAGLQQLAMQALPLNAVSSDCNQTIISPASMSNIDGLENCSFSAVCRTQDINFNGSDYKYFWFTSTGSCQIGSEFTSRTVSADAMQEQ